MTTIAVIPGDGIGPEVIDQAVRTVATLGLELDFDILDHINADTYLETGVALPDKDFDRVAGSDGILLGAVGDARADAEYARGVLLRLRFELDLFVNYRPATLFHDRLSPLREQARRPIDCVVIRENTEGLYTGIGGRLRPSTAHETAIDAEISTYHGVSRILEFAFATARRSVCMVDKSNAVRHGGALWQRCWHEAVRRHPEVAASHLYVDTAVMRLVQDPTAFDVIVTNNSYGDILSDLTADLAGGLGTAASANINGNNGFGLYEPVHGSAPDIAGTGTANPIGAILSAALLVERLGHTAAAHHLRDAVRAVIAAGQATPDLGGTLSTEDAGAAIRTQLHDRMRRPAP
ncbi:isocitrate/isopropylmalate dehydrogenase family protein [Nocardia brasiliensis]|uniref:3-isopropylmalate dehydrogenase n=1 Tax=Nocardia brasiliensis (strain ATCC 700358 / HUJEG-1) TaxID=1133849 RepID=K0EKY0_NOCB7|nr:isocitrate/isopropylmalate family dehydrogenase [Nocardia brasiliensis]AFU00113.1 3-isopropylmalate dehydrogenase [Nocardia brasiliensis ATCC 700358]OCF86302.1 dehydrogenase [Nocardia brasiliensis]